MFSNNNQSQSSSNQRQQQSGNQGFNSNLVQIFGKHNPNKNQRKRNRKRKNNNKKDKAPVGNSGTTSAFVTPSTNMPRVNPFQTMTSTGSKIDLPFDPVHERNDFNKNNAASMQHVSQMCSSNARGNSTKSHLNQERIPINFTFSALPKSVLMSIGKTIYLDTFSKLIYQPDKINFDRDALSRHDCWHQFVVHHNGKFRKREIIKSLLSVARTQEMFPIGYREYDLWDTFLLTASDRQAIETLFTRNLKIQIRDTEISLSVQLSAGQIEMGQLHPKAQIILVCQEILERANAHGNQNCLNLEGFERNSAFDEVCISLANDYHLTTVIKSLIEHDNEINSIRAIRFANCGLEKIDAMRYLTNFSKLTYLDLRNNNIENIFELKHLERLNLTDLDVAGNPFAEREELTHLQERVKKLLPTLKFLDGIELLVRIKLEPGTRNTEDLDFDIMLDGDPITMTDDLSAVYMSFKQRYSKSKYWHKVRVYHNGYYNRKQIVSKLLALVESNDLWPCYYASTPKVDEFYVHDNYEALEILVRNKLFIKSNGNEAPLELMLNMNVAPFKIGQVDIVEKIQKVCLEGMENNVLHLNNLADREIFKNIIIDMSSPRVVSQILLWASRKVGNQCTALYLNNNGIVSCKGMAPLHWFSKLEFLNLRNNLLESFERLSGIPNSNKINSVILEGNPLCNISFHQYIKNTKSYFPELNTLDGVPVHGEPLMLSRQNFLCKPEAYSFVESFLKQYFFIYDSNQKHLLKEMYMDQAIFTLSSYFDVNRSKEVSRMSKYTSKSRNIIRMTNLDQSAKNVFVGPEDIVKTLIELHSTEHNFMSFCIDVPIYTKNFIVITINGIFKDKAMQFLDDEFLLHFTRSFTIRSCNNCMGVSGISLQFKIQNDMLLVRNVSTQEKLNAIEQTPMKDEDTNDEQQENETENLTVLFQELTKLNINWCDKFLQEAKMNFKVALKMFVKVLEDDKIPEDAFISH